MDAVQRASLWAPVARATLLALLQDTMVFGLKGLSAYRHHAHELGADTSNVDRVMADTLYFTLTNSNFNFDEHIKQLLEVGGAGVEVMNLLSEAHTDLNLASQHQLE